MRPAHALVALGFLVVAACSSAETSSSDANLSSDLALEGEAPLLPDFKFDTGPMPSSGPAQLSLGFSVGGKLKVAARAKREGSALVGAPGGKLDLDMHVKLGGTLKVDTPAKKYDGELPGLKDIDIAIAGSAAFDGLLIDGEPVKLSAEVPETKLPDVPLGSIPGHLELTVSKDSRITSSYKGSCLSTRGGQATLAGTSGIGGKLVLNGKIVLEIPLYSKSIDLPPLTVDIPETAGALDTAATAASGIADATTGECGAAPASGEGAGSGSGSGGSEEPPACKPINVETNINLTCNRCLRDTCCAYDNACLNDAECKKMWDCAEACYSGDDQCFLQCGAQHPTAVDAYSKMKTCRQSWCTTECAY